MKWIERKRRNEISTVEVKLGSFYLTIHRHIHYKPEQWLASCSCGNGSLFDNKPLLNTELESAKREALKILRTILEISIGEIPVEVKKPVKVVLKDCREVSHE